MSPYNVVFPGLGLDILHSIPVGDEQAYKIWLENRRKEMDEHFENNKDHLETYMDCNIITETRPLGDIMIEWVYEMDLDHEVFLRKSVVSILNKVLILHNRWDSSVCPKHYALL
jgi:hypothetical protein